MDTRRPVPSIPQRWRARLGNGQKTSRRCLLRGGMCHAPAGTSHVSARLRIVDPRRGRRAASSRVEAARGKTATCHMQQSTHRPSVRVTLYRCTRGIAFAARSILPGSAMRLTFAAKNSPVASLGPRSTKPAVARPRASSPGPGRPDSDDTNRQSLTSPSAYQRRPQRQRRCNAPIVVHFGMT